MRQDANNVNNEQSISSNSQRLIPPRGDYQTLFSYQKSDVIYQLYCSSFYRVV